MDFKVVYGITSKQITQLLEYSKKDSQVKKFTSDPVRFKNRKAFASWSKEDRVIYTLVGNKEELYGLVWFGKRNLPSKSLIKKIERKDYGITFAIRTYGQARGRGLALHFMKKAFELFTSSTLYKSEKSNGIWLETSYDNLPAIKIYKKYGFVKVSNPDKKGKILMVLLDSNSNP